MRFMCGRIRIGCCDHERPRNWTLTKAAVSPTVKVRIRSTHCVCWRRHGAQRARRVGQWFAGRPIPGYYSAFMESEDGTPATLMHNGYGYFLASELVPWGNQNSRYSEAERVAIRKIAFQRYSRRKRRQGRNANRRHARKRASATVALPGRGCRTIRNPHRVL